MSPAAPGHRKAYLRFVGVSIVTVVTLVLLGWIPTRRWAGDAGGAAVFAGCAISLVAALTGGWFLVRAAERADRTGEPAPLAALGAMALRLGLTVALASGVALSGTVWSGNGIVPFKPFLLWIGVSYLVLLALETRLAVRLIGRGGSKTTEPKPARTGDGTQERGTQEHGMREHGNKGS